MSSRALRKLQREKEEQETLKRLEEEAKALEEEQESEDDEPLPVTKKSAFELLQEQEEANEDEDGEEDDGSAAEPESIATTPVQTAPKSTANKKKKRKKKGKKAADEKANGQTESNQASDLDDIDAALKELSTKGNASQHLTAAGIDPALDEANRLLAIDSSHLHASNEMRRLFGRAALEGDREDGAPPRVAMGGNRRQQRQQVGLRDALRGQRNDGRSGLSAVALRRNIFIQGKEDWPQATSGGLGMEVEEKCADGTVLYRFVHNTAYQDVQSQFETCVASMDPQRMIMLLQHNPYHISTLLQVSEIAKQERDFTTAGDLLERALFSFGRAVHSTFTKNLADGKARLDFRRPENREFWLASWRYMQNLTMRATYRTVYEWTKMLLSLSPQDDPYALWLVLDQYALRSKEQIDYLNISRNAVFKAVHEGMPNVQLSQALAECKAGNKGKGQQLLFTVVGRYPWYIARLMHELNVDAPPAVWGKEAASEKEKLYAELYATRAKDLWNTPENIELLQETASAVPAGTPAAPTDSSEIETNIARHVLLSDTPALIALIPREYTNQVENSADPLPPHDSITSYHLERRAPQLSQSGRGQQQVLAALQQALARASQRDPQHDEVQAVSRFFRDLFPWYNQRYPGAVGEDAEVEEPPATAAEMMTQVREAGRENAFEDHARRFIVLRGGVQPELDIERVHRLLVESAPLEPRTEQAGLDLQQLETLLRNEGLGQLDQQEGNLERLAAALDDVQNEGVETDEEDDFGMPGGFR
ncbi:hypothetical protein CKM354_000781900 [Cercospora kikuchii]|uniref:Ribosome quality control complex subunit 1 n=1 Tax=Cercospora kikuchii TaxID=84275 RepID=A0A9P3FHT7_9PEZI|nr:uncharacterized protein CKM354_000781900 [Cercospora kikuchii]GIZ44627.1 hypothetical protein CKM354_000781900 [Cercospora kikuchii]